MKITIVRALLLGLVASLAGWGGVLTFDGNICAASVTGVGAFTACPNGGAINQAYGDNANVDVVWGDPSGFSLERWDTGYSDLTNVAFGQFGTGPASVVLTPLGGMMVTLNSFQIGATPPNVVRSAIINVVDLATNTSVFSSTLSLSTTAATFTPGVSSLVGFRITWSDPGNDASNLGIDNLDFDLASVTGPGGGVPEPSTYGMLALAGGALLVRRFNAARRT